MSDHISEKLARAGINHASDGLLRVSIDRCLYEAAIDDLDAAFLRRQKELMVLQEVRHELVAFVEHRKKIAAKDKALAAEAASTDTLKRGKDNE